MVSNASELLPEPDTPLTTVSFPCGISHEMFFRLWVRAPRITIASFAEVNGNAPETALRLSRATEIAHAQAVAFRGDSPGTRRGMAQRNFDRLRTVLFMRIRTQSSNSYYKARRN